MVTRLALLAFMATFVFSTGQFEPINELYVFGDSLSDVGTVFQATRGTYPPQRTYFQGHYSNGRVWVEYLAFSPPPFQRVKPTILLALALPPLAIATVLYQAC